MKNTGLRTVSAFLTLVFCAATLFGFSSVAFSQKEPIQTKPQHLNFIEKVVIKDIVKSDLIETPTGSLLQLDGIRVPAYYEPLAIELLKTLVGQEINIHARAERRLDEMIVKKDRFGNRIVHAVTAEKNIWLQELLVAEGLAWAFSTETSRDLALPLLAFEEQARVAKKGFWGNPLFIVRKHNADIAKDINSFQIFEGEILNVVEKKIYIFFNFGADWKTDFTVRLPLKNVEAFREEGKKGKITFDKYKGAKVRVRGWVVDANGPMIELTHPEQWEIIEQAPVEE